MTHWSAIAAKGSRDSSVNQAIMGRDPQRLQMNGQQTPLSVRFPGGCYIGFNALVDRKAAEQLVLVCGQAVTNGYKEITICMTSGGGLLEHAYYAYGILDALPVKIITHNLGSVQSAANMLFLCGDERYATDGATFYFHKTSFEAPAGQRQTEELITERLKAIQYEDTRSAAIYATKTGRPVEDVRKWQNAELIMNTDVRIDRGKLGRRSHGGRNSDDLASP
jgi:ATP-dependent protease ClpP protease subunit